MLPSGWRVPATAMNSRPPREISVTRATVSRDRFNLLTQVTPHGAITPYESRRTESRGYRALLRRQDAMVQKGGRWAFLDRL